MSSFLTPEQIEQLKRCSMAKPAVMSRAWRDPNAQKNLFKQMGIQPVELSSDQLSQKPIALHASTAQRETWQRMNEPLATKTNQPLGLGGSLKRRTGTINISPDFSKINK